MAAHHTAEFRTPLRFHYAHLGGRATGDPHGMLDHNDGRYLTLRPGDSLTLETRDGEEFLSDNSMDGFDFEVEVHEGSRGSHHYNVEVSHRHPDNESFWLPVTHGLNDRWDLDSVTTRNGTPLRAARYVRVRNPANSPQPVLIDGAYVRTVRTCASAAACADRSHPVAGGAAAQVNTD